MKSAKKHRLLFATLVAVLVLAFVAPMIAREPSEGHFIFGAILLVVCPAVVYLVGKISDSVKNRHVS